jgi:hypothetical protein
LVNHLEAAQAVSDGLLVSLPSRGMVRGLLPAADGPFRQSCLAQMMGKKLRLAGNHIWMRSLQNHCDFRMQFLPSALEEAPVGGVPHQRVLEGVSRAGRRAAHGDQFNCHELPERGMEVVFILRADVGHHVIGELPAYHGGLLGHGLRSRHPVKSRHQAVVQGGRDSARLALQHGLGQLLDEQWHAVGTLEDLAEYFRRQSCAACDCLGKFGGFALRQASKRDQRYVRPCTPCGRELRPEMSH